MRRDQYKNYYSKAILFGIVVFVFLMCLTQLLAYQKYLLNVKDENELVIEHANVIKNQLQNSLYQSLSATKTLAFIVEKYDVPDDFDRIAKALTESVKCIDAIELVEKGVITKVYPLKGNEKAIGYNILEDNTRNKEALKSIERKDLFFAGPFKLKQGGFAVVGRHPIFRDKKFWGFSAVIIKFSTLLNAAGINIYDEKFDYQLSKTNPDNGKEEFFISNSNISNKTQTVSIHVPSGEWNLYVKLKKQTGYGSVWPIYLFGFLFSLMAGILTWLKLKEPAELTKKVEEKAYLLNRIEKRYRIIVENSLTPSFLGKTDGTILEANRAACELFGYTQEELRLIGRKGIAVQGEELELALKERSNTKVSQGEWFGLKKSGERFECEYSSIIFKDDNGEEFTSVMVNDISERKRQEREKQLALNINEIFNTEEGLENVLPQILKEVLNFCKKKAAEIWVTNIDNTELHLITQQTADVSIIKKSEKVSFKFGEGLPGMVWKNKSDVLVNDIENSNVYLRKDFAKENNLISSIGIPILFKDRVNGVIVIYSDTVIDKKESFVNLNPNIITQLAIEIQRKKSEAELNLFFNLSPDLLCLAGIDGYFKKINSAFEKVLGYSKEYLLSQSFIDIVHPEDRKNTIERLRELATGKSVYFFENRYLSATGSNIWLSWTAVPLENENLVIALGKDITERKKHEQQIFEKSKFIVDILESIGDAFFTLDNNFNVTYWNNVAEMLLQMPREKILGENLWDVFPEAKTLPSYLNYNKVMEEKTTMHFEDYYAPIKKWFEISAYPSETGISVYFKDITEKKLANEKLLKLNDQLIRQARELSVSNAELEQFAYIASHDLQEPLRMITSFLTQLESKYKNQLDEKAHQYIHFAVDGAKRMREIILDLLEYSRADKVNYKTELIDLNQLVNEIKLIYHKQISDKRAVIESDFLPSLFLPKTPIFQIFKNLIENALKYHMANIAPVIKITCKEEKEKWQFAVTDNGIGIEPEYFDKIFVIFQRLHTKSQFDGTGMGLAIVKKIISHMGGSIWVESSSGKGSTFYFTVLKEKHDGSLSV